MKFLETNTTSGENMLVPVSEIKSIYVQYKENGWAIIINGGDNFECYEGFGTDWDRLDIRYQMIKFALGVMSDQEIVDAMKAKAINAQKA